MGDLIYRQSAIDALANMYRAAEKWGQEADDDVIKARAESCMASLVEMKLRIENFPSAQRWIPCSERMPDENEAVNIVWVNRSPVIYYQDIKDKPQSATGVHYRGQWYWWSAVVQDYLAEYGDWDCDKMDDAIEVTHWQPLPEPPKEETK